MSGQVTVLLVDDEPLLLSGLRRVLQRAEPWTLLFAEGGEEARQILSTRHVDAVVTDLRMPDVDGLGVLRHALLAQPTAARIILTGHPDPAGDVEHVALAHSILHKPCDPTRLALTIRTGITEQAQDDDLQRAMRTLAALPTPRGLAGELDTVLDDPRSSVADVVPIVRRDVALTAKVMQAANSAAVGARVTVADLSVALPLLGAQFLRALAQTLLVVECLAGQVENRWLAAFNARATKVAADLAAAAEDERALAYIIGMLHDVGSLVVRIPAVADSCESITPEQRVRLGTHLLRLWSVPARICTVVEAQLGEGPDAEEPLVGHLRAILADTA